MKNLILVTICMICIVACKSNKSINANISQKPTSTYYLSEGACFGFCCVFQLTIESNGMVTYTGKQNCVKKGIYKKEINQDQVLELEQLFIEADFDSLPNFYPSDIADLKSVTLKRESGGIIKSTSFKENKPQILIEIKEFMKNIAESDEGWTAIKPEKEINPIPESTTGKNLNELIIEPKDDIQIGQWFKANKDRYGLILKRKVSPNSNYWLFEYDHTKFTAEEIISQLRKDTDLKSVDYNSEVKIRN